MKSLIAIVLLIVFATAASVFIYKQRASTHKQEIKKTEIPSDEFSQPHVPVSNNFVKPIIKEINTNSTPKIENVETQELSMVQMSFAQGFMQKKLADENAKIIFYEIKEFIYKISKRFWDKWK